MAEQRKILGFIRRGGRTIPIRAKSFDRTKQYEVPRSQAAHAGYQVGANVGAAVGTLFIRTSGASTFKGAALSLAKQGLKQAAIGAAIGGAAGAALSAATFPSKSRVLSKKNIENGKYKSRLVNPISTALGVIGTGYLLKTHSPIKGGLRSTYGGTVATIKGMAKDFKHWKLRRSLKVIKGGLPDLP